MASTLGGAWAPLEVVLVVGVMVGAVVVVGLVVGAGVVVGVVVGAVVGVVVVVGAGSAAGSGELSGNPL